MIGEHSEPIVGLVSTCIRIQFPNSQSLLYTQSTISIRARASNRIHPKDQAPAMSTDHHHSARPHRQTLQAPPLVRALGLAGISVLIITDYPLFFHPAPGDTFYAKIIHDRFFLIPHAVAGVLATALGPFQFSTRFRQRHLAIHRLMGKVYIVSIFFAAPMVFILSRGFTFPLAFMGGVQASLWFLCTLAAFITARNRQIAIHRQWMIRSYAFTLNFIFSRLLNFIPAYNSMSETGLAMTLALLTALYFFVPEIAFNWRELTHSPRLTLSRGCFASR